MNRVKNTALEVLREHEAGIKMEFDQGGGGKMTVRTHGDENARNTAFEELRSALAAMGATGPNYHFGKEGGNLVLQGEYWVTNSPRAAMELGMPVSTDRNSIETFAKRLANAGVNYPGSEAHRSPSVS